jgi:hypothetical protein
MKENTKQPWMKKQQFIGYLSRFLIWLAAIMAVTGIMDFILGWRTLFLYAESLFIVGGACIAIGAMGTMGRWSATRNFPYQYASSVSDANMSERTQQDVKDTEQSYSFSTLAILAGFTLVCLSILIHQII